MLAKFWTRASCVASWICFSNEQEEENHEQHIQTGVCHRFVLWRLWRVCYPYRLARLLPCNGLAGCRRYYDYAASSLRLCGTRNVSEQHSDNNRHCYLSDSLHSGRITLAARQHAPVIAKRRLTPALQRLCTTCGAITFWRSCRNPGRRRMKG